MRIQRLPPSLCPRPFLPHRPNLRILRRNLRLRPRQLPNRENLAASTRLIRASGDLAAKTKTLIGKKRSPRTGTALVPRQEISESRQAVHISPPCRPTQAAVHIRCGGTPAS